MEAGGWATGAVAGGGTWRLDRQGRLESPEQAVSCSPQEGGAGLGAGSQGDEKWR